MNTQFLKLTAAALVAAVGPLACGPLAWGQATPIRGASTSGSAAGGSNFGSSTAAPGLADKRTIEIFDALVTLTEDVKVPATELGMLTTIHVVEGQTIDEKALLADIDSRETIAKQLIAQGELDVAEAQAKSDAELIVAQKAVEVSQAELKSQQEIRDINKGAVSETEIRKYQFQLEKAFAQVKLAETDRGIAALTAKTKEAQLQALDIELDRRQVKAPFPGEVVEIFRKRGEWVQAGEPVMHIARLDKCRVKGFVLATASTPHELEGKPVEIEFQAANGKPLHVKGTVGYASEIIEGVGSSRQFRIWADIDNQKLTDPVTKKDYWAIQPGSMAKMTIDLTPPPAPKVTPIKPSLTPVRNESRKPVTNEPKER